jgi:hypothetical protein
MDFEKNMIGGCGQDLSSPCEHGIEPWGSMKC